jgi:hypothetical protein
LAPLDFSFLFLIVGAMTEALDMRDLFAVRIMAAHFSNPIMRTDITYGEYACVSYSVADILLDVREWSSVMLNEKVEKVLEKMGET